MRYGNWNSKNNWGEICYQSWFEIQLWSCNFFAWVTLLLFTCAFLACLICMVQAVLAWRRWYPWNWRCNRKNGCDVSLLLEWRVIFLCAPLPVAVWWIFLSYQSLYVVKSNTNNLFSAQQCCLILPANIRSYGVSEIASCWLLLKYVQSFTSFFSHFLARSQSNESASGHVYSPCLRLPLPMLVRRRIFPLLLFILVFRL